MTLINKDALLYSCVDVTVTVRKTVKQKTNVAISDEYESFPTKDSMLLRARQ